MVKKILIWKEKRRNKKLKCKLDGVREKLQTEKQRSRFLRKMLAQTARENGRLKDGYIVEWCKNCDRQIVMLWDPEKDGLVAHCPYCGVRMTLCESCTGECDFDYGTGKCKVAIVREV